MVSVFPKRCKRAGVNSASCCNSVAAKGMNAMQLAAEMGICASV